MTGNNQNDENVTDRITVNYLILLFLVVPENFQYSLINGFTIYCLLLAFVNQFCLFPGDKGNFSTPRTCPRHLTSLYSTSPMGLYLSLDV